MNARMNLAQSVPKIYQAVMAMDGAIRKSGLESDLLHLAKVRASQINGCAFCVDLHVKEALADGMDPQKLHLVAAWQESPFFSARERAALDWTEKVTLLPQTGAPDESFEVLRSELSPIETAQLTVAIAAINMLNRMAVSSRLQHPLS
jgi:AhpD family alkylhydroperoxidase